MVSSIHFGVSKVVTQQAIESIRENPDGHENSALTPRSKEKKRESHPKEGVRDSLTGTSNPEVRTWSNALIDLNLLVSAANIISAEVDKIERLMKDSFKANQENSVREAYSLAQERMDNAILSLTDHPGVGAYDGGFQQQLEDASALDSVTTEKEITDSRAFAEYLLSEARAMTDQLKPPPSEEGEPTEEELAEAMAEELGASVRGRAEEAVWGQANLDPLLVYDLLRL